MHKLINNQIQPNNILSICLLSEQCNLLQSLPRHFTITTNESSGQFNVSLLSSCSPTINSLTKGKSNITQYHLEISDNFNVLSKFEKLFQGFIVKFEPNEIPISRKIAKDLSLQSFCLSNNELIGGGYYIISKPSIISYYHKDIKNKDTFIIQTKKNEYRCNKLGVFSSSLISEILLKDPNTDHYIYDFEDSQNEFQLVCDIFNLKTVQLTNTNIDTIKQIAEDLKIECIFNNIERFTTYSENLSNTIDEQNNLIDQINEIFDLLYNIKEKTVDSVADEIKRSRWSKTEDNISELAAFIYQVINTDMKSHPYIIDLLIKINEDDDNQSNYLKTLLPFIKSILMQSFSDIINYSHNFDLITPFIYKMYEKGIISKEELNSKLKNCQLTNSFFVSWFLPELIELDHNVMDFCISNEQKNPAMNKPTAPVLGTDNRAHDLNTSVPTDIEQGAVGQTAVTSLKGNAFGQGTGTGLKKSIPVNPSNTGAIALGAGPSLNKGVGLGAGPSLNKGVGLGAGPSLNKGVGLGAGPSFKKGVGLGAVLGHKPKLFGLKGKKDDEATFKLIYPSDPNKIEEFKRMREKCECDDEIAAALRNDDVDTFQSIISKNEDVLIEERIKKNIFEPFDNIRFLNYAAAYGSVKCFKYLLLNNEQIDNLTFEMSIIGGNNEIIRIIDNEKIEPEAETIHHRKILGKRLSNPAIRPLLKSIELHRNGLFDWLLEQRLSKLKFNDLVELARNSVENGSIHSLIHLIDNGFTFYDSFNDLLTISCGKGFHLLTKFLLTINDIKPASQKVNTTKEITKFDNVSTIQLFEDKVDQEALENTLASAISSNSIRIIKYFFETLINQKFQFNAYNALFILLHSFQNYSDATFDYLMNTVSKIYTFDDKSLFKLLNEAIYHKNIEASKKIANMIYDENPYSDFTSAFMSVITSPSKEIAEYFLSQKYMFDSEKLAKEIDNLKNVDYNVFSILEFNDEIKKKMKNIVNTAISTNNISLVKYLLKEGYPYENSLILASKSNNLELVEAILEINSSPSFINKVAQEGTALISSINSANCDIFKKLISVPGIDPSLYSQKDQTCIILSIIRYREDILNLLLEFYGENIVKFKNQIEDALVILSSKKLNKNNASILLKIVQLNCINPNLRLNNNNTLLTLAIQLDLNEVVEVLLQYETIDVNFPNLFDGDSPLIRAIQFNNDEVARLLLQHPKIDVNHKNNNGKTAFYFAVSKNKIDICTLIYEKDDFNPEENNLGLAFYVSNGEISRLLLSIESIDVNYVPFDSQEFINISDEKKIIKSSLTKAISNNDMELLNLVIQHPSFKINKYQIIDALSLCIYMKKQEFFDVIFKLAEQINIDINSRIFGGNSPLVEAVLAKSNKEMLLGILNWQNFDSKKSDIAKAFNNSYPKFSIQPRNYIRNENNKVGSGKGYILKPKYLGGVPVGMPKTLPINSLGKGKPGSLGGGTLFGKGKPGGKLLHLKKKLSTGSYELQICELLYNYDCEHDHLIDLNKPDENGITIFEHSIRTNSTDIALWLIQLDVIDFSKQVKYNNHDTTFLNLAIELGNYSIADEMITRKLCDINKADSLGNTPLMNACMKKNTDIIDHLFTFDNLDFLHRNNDGKDALEIIKINSPLEEEKTKETTDKDEYLSELKRIGSEGSNVRATLLRRGFGRPTLGRPKLGQPQQLQAVQTTSIKKFGLGQISLKVKPNETNQTLKVQPVQNTSVKKFGLGQISLKAKPNETNQTPEIQPVQNTSAKKFGFGQRKLETEPNESNKTLELPSVQNTSAKKFGFGQRKLEAKPNESNQTPEVPSIQNTSAKKFGFGQRKLETEPNENNQTPEVPSVQNTSAKKFGFGQRKLEAKPNENNQTPELPSVQNTSAKKFGFRQRKLETEPNENEPSSFISTNSSQEEQILQMKPDQQESSFPTNEIKSRDVSNLPSRFNFNVTEPVSIENEQKQKPRPFMRKWERRSSFQSDDENDEIFLDSFEEEEQHQKRRRKHRRHHHYQQEQQQFNGPNPLLLLEQQQQQWMQMINMNNVLQAQLNMQLMNQNQMMKKQIKRKRRGKSVK